MLDVPPTLDEGQGPLQHGLQGSQLGVVQLGQSWHTETGRYDGLQCLLLDIVTCEGEREGEGEGEGEERENERWIKWIKLFRWMNRNGLKK